jgi:hypothetical protein
MDVAATHIGRKRDTGAIAADNQLYCWVEATVLPKEERHPQPSSAAKCLQLTLMSLRAQHVRQRAHAHCLCALVQRSLIDNAHSFTRGEQEGAGGRVLHWRGARACIDTDSSSLYVCLCLLHAVLHTCPQPLLQVLGKGNSKANTPADLGPPAPQNCMLLGAHHHCLVLVVLVGIDALLGCAA